MHVNSVLSIDTSFFEAQIPVPFFLDSTGLLEASSVYYSVRKVSDLIFFFCRNLVDLNEGHLYEATLNLYMNA